jgi:hypothetical protein
MDDGAHTADLGRPDKIRAPAHRIPQECWLDSCKVADAWDLAPALVNALMKRSAPSSGSKSRAGLGDCLYRRALTMMVGGFPCYSCRKLRPLVRWGGHVLPRIPRRRFEGTEAALKRIEGLLEKCALRAGRTLAWLRVCAVIAYDYHTIYSILEAQARC